MHQRGVAELNAPFPRLRPIFIFICQGRRVFIAACRDYIPINIDFGRGCLSRRSSDLQCNKDLSSNRRSARCIFRYLRTPATIAATPLYRTFSRELDGVAIFFHTHVCIFRAAGFVYASLLSNLLALSPIVRLSGKNLANYFRRGRGENLPFRRKCCTMKNERRSFVTATLNENGH